MSNHNHKWSKLFENCFSFEVEVNCYWNFHPCTTDDQLTMSLNKLPWYRLMIMRLSETFFISAITWHDIQQFSINLPEFTRLFNIWTEKIIHVNFCKIAIDLKKNNLYLFSYIPNLQSRPVKENRLEHLYESMQLTEKVEGWELR